MSMRSERSVYIITDQNELIHCRTARVHTAISGLCSTGPTPSIIFCLPTKTIPQPTVTSQSIGHFIVAMGAEPSHCRPAERWAHERRRNVHTRCFIASADLREIRDRTLRLIGVNIIEETSICRCRAAACVFCLQPRSDGPCSASYLRLHSLLLQLRPNLGIV